MARVTRMLLAGLVLALPTALFAADPPAGTYKLMLPSGKGVSSALWLIKLDVKDDKWTGTATPPPQGLDAEVKGVKVDKGTLRFTLDTKNGALAFEGRVPAEKGAKILGTLSAQEDVLPAALEPTALASLDPFDLGREALAKSTDNDEVFEAAMTCLSGAAAKKAKPEDAKEWAAKAVKAAEPYGPRWKRTVVLRVAEVLAAQKGFEGLALDYAEQAEKALDPTDSPVRQKRVLTVLADVLDRAGRAEDARKVRERNDKISPVVLKTYPGRKKGDRVALVEVFTSAQQPSCAATDFATAALLATYKPTDVVLLQYHLPTVNAGDPLGCPEAEARSRFYETRRETPLVFFNGGRGQPVGGPAAESQAAYDEFVKHLDEQLEKPAKARLTAAATRKGARVEIKVDVSDLQESGAETRLRVALVEEEVSYTGADQVTKHVQVVRHFAGGAAGAVMKSKTASQTYTVDLDAVRKQVNDYLDKVNADKPFPGRDRPLDLKKLRVVAFVQNDETSEVLNSVQVDVKGE